MYPGLLRQIRICRLSETTEKSMNGIYDHVLQLVQGTKNLWREGQCWVEGGVGGQEHLDKTSIV